MSKEKVDRMLRIIFEGFCDRNERYSSCILLLDANSFSVTTIFNLVRYYQFQICSELKIDLLINDLCRREQGDFKECYKEALVKGHCFKSFPESSINTLFRFGIPRFTEADFQHAIEQLGGDKIKENTSKTPDFLIGNIAVELKDLQKEGLYDSERQKSISKVFENSDKDVINIDPSFMSKEELETYKRIISNSIKSIVKKASTQVKEYKLTDKTSGAGVILTNTGFFSLGHDLFKEIVQDIITNQTKTIEFAYIFTQSVLRNAIGDYEVFYYNDFIGIVPDAINEIQDKINNIIEKKMTSIFHSPNQKNTIQTQQPISFLVNDKIFYWAPRKIEPSWNPK